MNLSNSVLVFAALSFSAAVFSADNPTYSNGVLTVPRVDIPDQVGKYQDVTFQLTQQGTWTLTAVQEFSSLSVSEVEVIKTGTFPVSVYLRASGWRSSCGYSGAARIHQRLEGLQFDIGITALHTDEYGTGEIIVCAESVFVFKMTVPLQVYGLSAGTYTYNVNGVTGTFNLESDNKYPDDCDAASNTNCQ